MKKRYSKEITNPKDVEEILSLTNERASWRFWERSKI